MSEGENAPLVMVKSDRLNETAEPHSNENQKDTLLQKNEESNARDGLSDMQMRAYKSGHFNNDLCASMWFIYLTYYLTYVVGLDSQVVAGALLSGQITDGITTPIVGTLSDKVNCPCGKRMGWYIFGSLLVVPAFSGIFVDFGFLKNATNQKFVNTWYLVLPAIFNIGWAAVQISTMAIVPSLTYSQRRRDEMVNGRNIFTYLANIFMLTLSLILFLTIPSASFTFTLLTLICLVIGGMTTIFFIVLIRERKLSEEALELDKKYKERMN